LKFRRQIRRAEKKRTQVQLHLKKTEPSKRASKRVIQEATKREAHSFGTAKETFC